MNSDVYAFKDSRRCELPISTLINLVSQDVRAAITWELDRHIRLNGLRSEMFLLHESIDNTLTNAIDSWEFTEEDIEWQR